MPEGFSTRFEMISPAIMDNNAWNPNSMEQDEFNRLVKEIEDVGFIDTVQAVPMDDGRFRIIGGEHRVAAAVELELDSIPTMVLDGPKWQDEDLQKLVTVRLNVLKGKLNPDKMAILYREMAKKYGEDALQGLFAYTDQHGWDKLVSGIKQGLSKAGLPPDKQKEFAKKAKEAKTLKDLERILNELWSSYGDTVQLSFMIFTYGKREHIYVAMNRKTRAAIKKVADHCKVHAKDINTVLGPAIVALADVLAKEPPPPKSPPEQDDVAF
jgi:ParB/Sulfiredoxin domain